MKLKRFLAVSAACAVAAAGISVQAGAAGRFRLFIEPVSTVDGADNAGRMYAYGKNMPMLYDNGNGGISGLFDITADDLDTWRETGEFSYTPVESDLDFDQTVSYFNDCPVMLYIDAEGNIAERLAVQYDGKGKLDITKQSEDYFYLTFDGWILEEKEVEGEEQSTLTITATSPDGKTISKEIQYDTYCIPRYVSNDKYLGYIMYATGSSELSKRYGEYAEAGVRNWDVRVDALTKDGELENIYSGIKLDNEDSLSINGFGITDRDDNYFMFSLGRIATGDVQVLFFPDTGELKAFHEMEAIIDSVTEQDDSGRATVTAPFYFDDIIDRQGDNLIFTVKSFNGKFEGDSVYCLARFGDEDEWRSGQYGVTVYDCKAISDTYKHMSTEDGELYLVQTLDDKWGFMNANGELLATYDDAGAFIGKYAPVIKDGKAFLINRDFKRVSEKIDAEGVGTIDKGLYLVTINGEKYFMTYAAAQEEQAEQPDQTEPEDKPEEPAETAEPSKPVEPEQPDTPSESAQTAEAAGDNSGDNGADKTNPDTGAASAAAVLGLGVIAAGAVILSRKRG